MVNMANVLLISLHLIVACTVIECMSDTLKTDVQRLKLDVGILNGKTDYLQEAVDILRTVIKPGIVVTEYGNKSRSDTGKYEDFKTKIHETLANAEDFKTKINETIANAEDLEFEVNSLIQVSRYGFMNEKEWNREFMANLTGLFEDFETDVTKKNKKVRQRLETLSAELDRKDEVWNRKLQTIEAGLNERLDENEKRYVELERKDDICKNKLQTIETDLNERLGECEKKYAKLERKDEVWNRKLQTIEAGLNERLSASEKRYVELERKDEIRKNKLQTIETNLKQRCDNLRADQDKLESENRVLGKTISELQTEHWAYFNGHYYLVVKLEKNWDDASDYCKNRDSYLIEITTDEEMQFVEELVHDYQGSDARFWIGVNDRAKEGKFKYPRSREKVPEKFWALNQPNNNAVGGIAEDCVIIMRSDRELSLNDITCDKKRHFICEKS